MTSTISRQRVIASTCAICEYRQSIGQIRAPRNFNYRSLSYPSTSLTHLARGPLWQRQSSRKIVCHVRRLTADAEITSRSGPSSIPEYSFSLKPKDVRPDSRSQIRQSLRQWSLQNEKSKKETALESIPSEGRVTRLPNALFIDAETASQSETDKNQGISIDEDVDEGVVGPVGQALLPGTLIGHSSLTVKRQDVVYLGDIGVQSLLLLANGTWAVETMNSKLVQPSRLRLAPIPNFLSPEEVKNLQAYMPRRDVTRALEEGGPSTAIFVTGSFPEDVTASVTTKLRAFQSAKDRFIRDHKTQLEQMYDLLAFKSQWRKLLLQELPPIVLGMEYGDMSDIAKYTFVEHATRFHPLVAPVQTAETITFYIGPKSLNEDVAEVQEWARLYQEAAAQAAVGKNVSALLRENPLSSFIDKARRIILKSRNLRTPTSLDFLGPSSHQPKDGSNEKVSSGETFTKDDTKILRYLYDVAFRRPISGLPKAHASLIVRAVGAYPSTDLNLPIFRMFMHELGCVNQWVMYDDISLPVSLGTMSAELNQLQHEASAAVTPMIDEKKTCTAFADSMAHMRKDWGDMEAYCIDRTGTTNVEDAVSIEPDGQLEGGYWLHCHFAHPTSHLDKDHPLVRMARKIGTAYYSMDEMQAVTPMVPFEVIRQFSIQGGSPVLTVSTLMTKDGRVHDVKIVPATLRQVKLIDSDALAEAMGIKEESDEAILIVGKVSKVPKAVRDNGFRYNRGFGQIESGVQPFLPNLNTMRELLSARLERRKQEVTTPARFPRNDFQVDVSTRLPEGKRSGPDFESYHWRADPGLMLKARRRTDTNLTMDRHRANDITTQAMRLAAESVGKWMADRKIPAVFLGNATPAGFSIDQVNNRSHHDEPIKPVFLRTSFPNPVIHHNLQQYAACTSPLRKFIDMFNHFQVDSYLMAQADGLLRADQAIEDDSILAFSKSEVEEFLKQDIHAGDAITHDLMEHKEFWVTQALFRAFHFNEATLPETMEVIITTPTKRDATGKLRPASGVLVPWAISVELEETVEGYEKAARVKDFVPIKIINVYPTRRLVSARAVGPASVEQQTLHPVKCYGSANIIPRSILSRPDRAYTTHSGIVGNGKN